MSIDPRQLADIEAIKQLKARYCLLLDAQEWDDLRDLFTDDCRFSVGSGDYDDPDSFVERLRENLTGESHVHIASMPIIDLTGPDSARGLWTFENRGALGHYQDRYARTPQGWRIAAMRMTWIHAPSEELLRTRKGQFAEREERWKQIASDWGT